MDAIEPAISWTLSREKNTVTSKLTEEMASASFISDVFYRNLTESYECKAVKNI